MSPDQTSDFLIRIFIQGLLSFTIAICLTPVYTYFAYRYKLWKKPRQTSSTGETASLFISLHAEKHKRNIPTMAGIIIILSVVLSTVLSDNLSRSQTWLPIFGLVAAGAVGATDDLINLSRFKAEGLKITAKFLSVLVIAVLAGLYFYLKLDYSSISIPLLGSHDLGWMIIPLFAIVVVSSANAVNISDGLDGLSGGLLCMAFTSFSIIALLRGQIGLAVFCAALTGASLAYTWFSIYPARFFMGDIGSFSLGTSLGIIAMLTDSLFLLPIIGFVFVIETLSSIIQIGSKRLFNKKVFRLAPLHHHFEAVGWPETKVTMRFWIIGAISAMLGIILSLI